MWCTMLGTNKHQGNIQRILTKADLDKLKAAKPSGSQLVDQHHPGCPSQEDHEGREAKICHEGHKGYQGNEAKTGHEGHQGHEAKGDHEGHEGHQGNEGQIGHHQGHEGYHIK